MKVAVFGGSFNPPHFGHQVLCLLLLETGLVDQIWLVPTYKHYFGKALANYEARVRLCKELIAPFGNKAAVDTIERELSTTEKGQEGSRMFDTLQALQEKHRGVQFHLVVGADILLETDKWYRWPEIEALAPPIVVQRRGYEGGVLPAPPEISSSAIRDRLSRGEAVDAWVPERVLKSILAGKLYV